MKLQPADAEDVVQDAMLRAWERRAEWETVKNKEAWLVQICKRLVLDRMKRAQYQELSADTALSHVPSAMTADKPVEHEETVSLMGHLISQLEPPQDELIRLRDIEGMNYREIGERLELTDAQVRVYLHRARTRLRALFLKNQTT